MLVMSIRSSSVGSWSMCPMKYFLSYVVGQREQANFKTIKGSISHKALELLARKNFSGPRTKR
jgi:CRISPR/Cas system-associated exonuclease Cas4 (RecB family)